jgi:adenosine deaminase
MKPLAQNLACHVNQSLTMPKNILLCTLGASWAVIPEILGWLAPNVLDLYAHHPKRPALDQLRAQHQLQAPDELWICTTQGAQTQASLAALSHWWQLLGAPMPLRIWAAAGTDQLANQAECEHIRELILRTTLLASEQVGSGQLVLSLAGGRKTMSADLQTAGAIFGAQAWLHVVSPEPSPPALFARTPAEKAEQPKLMALALAADLAVCIMPLVAGIGTRNELLDLVIDGQRVDSSRFALRLAGANQVLAWPLPEPGDTLQRELMRRQTQSSQLMGNFLAQLAQTEHHENWRSLYRLPPSQIELLRNTYLHAGHADWLTALPKADLHRHLGGCLDLSAQREVARCIWTSLNKEKRLHRLQILRELLSQTEWPWDWPNTLRGQHRAEIRAELCAGLLLHASLAQLQHNLYGVTDPRLALKTSHPRGFSAFERPGELSGSALLSHPAALKPYAQAIVAQARLEGLAYLELRGSPHKYRKLDPAGFVRDLRQALLEAAAGDLRIGFIWILDRRQPQTLAKTVQQAILAKELAGDFMLGLDLAGDEASSTPEQLATHFLPAFANCLPITIHAGEGQAAHNIWQAAYHLHADRIGHGLTLADKPALAARFRDRGICLELCPSSNREVVGFADPAWPESAHMARYPLRAFMQMGLPLTLCTDNPGLSRTTLAGEYLTAARMSEGGLTLWETLALMRQAFVHAFLPSFDREVLLKQVDAQVFALIANRNTENAHDQLGH